MARCANPRASCGPSLRSMWQVLRFRSLRPPPLPNPSRVDAPRSKSPRRKTTNNANRAMPIQYRRQMHHLRITICRMQNLRMQGRCRFPEPLKRIGLAEIQGRLHQLQNPLPLHRPAKRAEQSVGYPTPGCMFSNAKSPRSTAILAIVPPASRGTAILAVVAPASSPCPTSNTVRISCPPRAVLQKSLSRPAPNTTSLAF